MILKIDNVKGTIKEGDPRFSFGYFLAHAIAHGRYDVVYFGY